MKPSHNQPPRPQSQSQPVETPTKATQQTQTEVIEIAEGRQKVRSISRYYTISPSGRRRYVR